MTCDACDGLLPDDARWCGRCGAAVGPPPLPTADTTPTAGSPPGLPGATDRPVPAPGQVLVVEDDDPGPVGVPVRGADGRDVRSVGRVAGVAVLLLGLGLLALLLRPVEPASLLGRLDVATGASAPLAPGPLDVVRWRLPAGAAAPTVAPRTPLALPAGAGHLALRPGRVVATEDGVTTRVTAPAVPSPDGVEVRLDGSELVLLDATTGAVAGSVGIEWPRPSPPREVLGRAGGGVLVADVGTFGVLALDGTTRWLAPSGVAPPPAGTVADRWLVLPATDGTGLHVALDATTGAVVGRFAPLGAVDRPRPVVPITGPSVAATVDQRALVAWGLPAGREVWRLPLPEGARVTLSDAVDVLAAEIVVDGGGSSAASAVVTRVVRFDTATGERISEVPGASSGDGRVPSPGTWDADARGVAVVADGRLVVRRWDGGDPVGSPLVGVREVALVGDHVVARVVRPDGVEAVAVVDRRDGTVVHEGAGDPTPGPVLVAALDGHVALAQQDARDLRGLRWVRVRDGALRPSRAVLTGDVTTDDDLRFVGLLPDGGPLLVDAVRDDRLVVVVGDGPGVQVRIQPVGDVAASLPVVVGISDGLLVLRVTGGSGSRLVLVDPATGGATTLDGFAALSVAAQGVLAVDDEDARLVVVDARTLAVRRDVDGPVGAVARAVAMSAVRSGDVLVGADRAGTNLVAVSAQDAAPRWRVPLGSGLVTGPVVVGPLVAHVGGDGVVRTHEAATGRPAWTLDTGTATTALSAAGDTLVLGTQDGRVVVVGEDGVVREELVIGRVPVQAVAVVGREVVAVVGGEVVGLGRDDGTVPAQDTVELP